MQAEAPLETNVAALAQEVGIQNQMERNLVSYLIIKRRLGLVCSAPRSMLFTVFPLEIRQKCP